MSPAMLFVLSSIRNDQRSFPWAWNNPKEPPLNAWLRATSVTRSYLVQNTQD